MRANDAASWRCALILLAVWAGFSPADAPAQTADLNLLLITIDTLRPDRLSCYSSKYVRTPAIDAVAAQGLLFEKAFAHTPSTLPSHADIFLGSTPPYHGVSENSKAKVADEYLTLAEHLKAAGYATGAFVGAFPLATRFGLKQGFDIYDDAFPKIALGAGSSSLERKAEQVIDPALAWLNKRTGKWFCWIHLWDPHAPYLPPEPYLSRYKYDPYSGEAAYVDAELGRLFADLRKDGRLDRTLIVLTADHGESLGEHGELTHSYFAYDSTLHVPLIMAGPGIRAGRVSDFVSHVDIFPTVCDLLKVKRPASGLQGESLMPLIRGKAMAPRPIYIESLEPYLNKGCAPLRGFIADRKKYLDSPIPELYDLDGDFDEKENLAPKTDLAPYKKKLQDLGKSLASPSRSGGNQPADRQTLERLRSLGYLVSSVSQIKTSYGPEDDLKSFLPYQQNLDRAIILGDQGKAEESIPIISDIIRDKENFGPAYTYLAEIYLAQGRIREAVRTFDDGCRRNPKNYNLFSAYGMLLVKYAQWDKADEILQKALALIDFDPEIWVDLGIVRMSQGDLPKAVESFDKALALDKAFVPAYFNKGAVYLNLGRAPDDLARSIENLRQAVSLDPNLNLGWRGLGVAYQKEGKAEAALGAWERAVIADETDEFSTLNLGQAYLAKSDKSRARKCFERYLKLRGDRITAVERDEIQALIDKCR